MNNKERLSLVIILIMLLASCGEKQHSPVSELPPSSQALSAPDISEPSESDTAPATQDEPAPKILQEDKSYIFLERNTDATDGGVARLIEKMATEGLPFYKTALATNGMIATDDVVLLKINCQWAERGGTNTDLIRAVAEMIAAHPEGFTGEIIIADNGQGQYGTNGRGGSLDWSQPNSALQDQSTMDVVKQLQGQMHISGYLWDDITMNRVSEFSEGDLTDGFVIEDGILKTGLEISYPKFTTLYGTQVSFKRGIWDDATETYYPDKLNVINMPVLKSHGIYHVTGAVKSYMGVVASRLTGQRPHNSVDSGGMGTLMANTRMPVLNIIDMIWVGAGRGPGATYDSAVSVNAIAASTDPAALDYWAAKNILLPELSESMRANSSPDSNTPRSFGYWLRLSATEIEKAGFRAALDENEILMLE